MIYLINVLVLCGSLVYMSLTAILGMHFSPEEGAGPAYKLYMVALFSVSVLIFLKNLFIRRLYKVNDLIPMFILLIYIIVGYIQLTIDNLVFLQMVCFSTPAVCVALNLKSPNDLTMIMKWLDLLLPLFAFSFVFMVKSIMLNKIDDPNAYDQSASYFSAFCFLLDIYLLRYNRLYPKFRYLDNKWYRLLKVLFLPYFIIICFFSGGRGAFVTMLVGIIFNIGILKHTNKRVLLKFILGGFLMLFLVVLAINQLNKDFFDLLSDNFGRIYALVEGGHINTSASSGRDNIWGKSLEMFLESPLYGYGLFSYLSVFMYPHNIFLEIMLQGGLLLLIVFCLILFSSYVKFRRMLKKDVTQLFLIPFILYVSTSLFFSGSYTFQPYFWFVLTYINYFYRIRKNARH